VRRHGPILLVLALLVGTAAAFAVAERVKLEKSPIRGPRVTSPFSPVCECPNRRAEISFRLSRPDTVGVGIVDADGHLVRTIARDRRYLALHRLEFEWDGRDSDGLVVAEGLYQPRVHFADRDRTIVLPNTIRVDTTPPEISSTGVRPRVFSPDGDGRRDGIAVRYAVNEKAARALLLVDGTRRVRGKLRDELKGQLQWYGRVGGASLPAGTYRLQLLGEDEAGNLSAPVAAGTVRIRYIEVAPRQVRVPLRSRFRVVIDTDAASYTWRFAGRSGVAHGPALVLRARKRGRFALVVEESGHRARTVVVVTRAPKPK
jgi:hypothetical protein